MFPAAILFCWSPPRSSITNTSPSRCGRPHISRKKATLRAGSPLHASRDERGQMKMSYRFLWFLPALLISTVLYAQRGPAAFNIDLMGFWTPPLHEDSLERGNGPELADYGGFALNEA